MTQTRYCLRHPKTQTNLACGKCGNPVCPRCLVHTPVGVRCPECANVRRLPTFDVSGIYLARAVGAGLALALASGFAFVFLAPYIRGIPYATLIVIVGLGFLIGEGISLAVNRKRGRVLKYVASGATLMACAIIFLFSFTFFSLFSLLAVALAVYIAVNRF